MPDQNTYNDELNCGISLTGESKNFFAVERIKAIKGALPPGTSVKRILDFGCSTGDTTHFLAEQFTEAEVVGYDPDNEKIEHAKSHYSRERVSFVNQEELSKAQEFDVCYVNGVFHHIPASEQPGAIDLIFRHLNPSGYFGFFENNPWNPGTRLVMKKIPFDRDAVTISSPKAKRLLKKGGFVLTTPARFLFFFPSFLSVFRFMEKYLVHLPLGGQYMLLAQKLPDTEVT